MRQQLMNDGNGNYILNDTNDNCLLVSTNWLQKHYCNNCGTTTNDMEFIQEVGYYEREVMYKCKCGKHVLIQG